MELLTLMKHDVLFLYRCLLFCCQIQLLGKVRRWTERVLAGQRETLSTREYCIRFEMSLLQECPVQDLSTTFEIKHRSYQTTSCSEKVDIDLLTKAALLQIIFDNFPRNLERFSPFCHVILLRHVILDMFYSSSLLLDFQEVMNQSIRGWDTLTVL